jgi:pSer/pThr/pTyr-binding forkhead associated (FHA) protein
MVDDIFKTEFLDPNRRPGRHREGAELVTLEGTQTGVAHPLINARTTIGRLDGNDLVLASGPVSKRHAAMIQENGVFFIEDLGSTNGVVVNSTRLAVDSRRRLYHGDNIRISDHLFLFRQESSFVDGEGVCSIELDHDKVRAEVQEVLAEWKDLRDDRGTREIS